MMLSLQDAAAGGCISMSDLPFEDETIIIVIVGSHQAWLLQSTHSLGAC
jgi:hypothetical protein